MIPSKTDRLESHLNSAVDDKAVSTFAREGGLGIKRRADIPANSRGHAGSDLAIGAVLAGNRGEHRKQRRSHESSRERACGTREIMLGGDVDERTVEGSAKLEWEAQLNPRVAGQAVERLLVHHPGQETVAGFRVALNDGAGVVDAGDRPGADWPGVEEIAGFGRRREGIGAGAAVNGVYYALAVESVVVMAIGEESVGEQVGVGERAIAGELIGIDAIMGVLDAEADGRVRVSEHASEQQPRIEPVLGPNHAADGTVIVARGIELTCEVAAAVIDIAVDRPPAFGTAALKAFGERRQAPLGVKAAQYGRSETPGQAGGDAPLRHHGGWRIDLVRHVGRDQRHRRRRWDEPSSRRSSLNNLPARCPGWGVHLRYWRDRPRNWWRW